VVVAGRPLPLTLIARLASTRSLRKADLAFDCASLSFSEMLIAPAPSSTLTSSENDALKALREWMALHCVVFHWREKKSCSFAFGKAKQKVSKSFHRAKAKAKPHQRVYVSRRVSGRQVCAHGTDIERKLCAPRSCIQLAFRRCTVSCTKSQIII
jgi:hypothetical protein